MSKTELAGFLQKMFRFRPNRPVPQFLDLFLDQILSVILNGLESQVYFFEIKDSATSWIKWLGYDKLVLVWKRCPAKSGEEDST